MSEATISRDELVTIAQAVEEFRDESSGPHLDLNRELANRLRAVLAASGDEFVVAPGESELAAAIRRAGEAVERAVRQNREGLRVSPAGVALGEIERLLRLVAPGDPPTPSI